MFLAGAVYLFVFSPVFKIAEIKMSGNNLIASEQIESTVRSVLQSKILKIIPSDTTLALIGERIKKDILKAYPEIATVDIKRESISGLAVTVTEKQAAAVICLSAAPSPSATLSPSPFLSASPIASSFSVEHSQEKLPESGQCFFTDGAGLIYRGAPEISGTLLPTFYSDNAQLLQIGSAAISSTTLQFSLVLKKELRQAGVDLTGFILNDDVTPELKAFTSEGWLIYFDRERPALTQAKILETLLNGEIKDKRATLQYVDLRVEDRAYYK